MHAFRLRGGSRIVARDRAPAIQLATLAMLLAKAIPVGPTGSAARGDASSPTGSMRGGAPGVEALPFALLDGDKLRLNIASALTRLVKQPEFLTAFDEGDATGFLRDAHPPPYGMTARMGGRLVDGSAQATTRAIDALRDAMSAEIDRALGESDPSALVADDLRSAMPAMASTLALSEREAASVLKLPQLASMVPVRFADEDRPAAEREKDIGRVLSGIEKVDGRDWLKLLLSGIERRLQNDGEDPDEVAEIIAALQAQGALPGSQLQRFLEFLEDEAMARVRLQVCMRLMEAVAAQAPQDRDDAGGAGALERYVRRVRACFEAFAGPQGESLLLDISSGYGLSNNTDLAMQFRKAMFYGCLPVWAECSVQLFERRVDPDQEIATLREVSYRFRVNGDNPETGRSAFATRLERIRERLCLARRADAGLQAEEEPGASPDVHDDVRRPVAELVFLSLVIPASAGETAGRGHDPTQGDPDDDVAAHAAQIAAALKADPRGELQRLHDALDERATVMEALAGALISTLRTKSRAIVSATNRGADRLMISVHRDVVDWAIVRGLGSQTEEILVKPETGPDTIAWFEHIRVAPAPWNGSLASIQIDTELQERSLTPAGEAQTLPMARDLRAPVLAVRLTPHLHDKASGAWRPLAEKPRLFDIGRGVDVEYDLRLLMQKRREGAGKLKAEQYRSATLAAAAMLIHLALRDLVRRIKATTPALTMTLVRLQHTGRQRSNEDDAADGNTAIYAISQAIETTLTRELPVKLQGLTTRDEPGRSPKWKHAGSLAALHGGQPVRFVQEGALDKVAVITYVTRPSDSHPDFPGADGHLFISRTYVADSHEGETLLRVDRMLSRQVENRQDFRTPHLILEEVARLRALGHRHILLLSHHFGNRHIGRTAERHAPHATLEFLEQAAMRFPDVHVYPLRRDVFPATRLRRRQSAESGFEVLRHDAHQAMYAGDGLDVLRSLMPVYTFATLHVVDEDRRPQSGFCTYFFDAEHRLSDFNLRERTRVNILGVGEAARVRESLVSVLRAIHFMESEKPALKGWLLPVLDPFDWATPTTTAAAGEIVVRSRRGGRRVLLSIPAILAHVSRVLYREADDDA